MLLSRPSILFNAAAFVSSFLFITGSALGFPSSGRIVFLGDSLTEQGSFPGGFIDLIQTHVTSQPDLRAVQLSGAGVPGNTAADGLKRLDSDVLKQKPTHVVVLLGINDVWTRPDANDPKVIAEFRRTYAAIIEKIVKAGAAPVICTLTVIGEKKLGQNKLDYLVDLYSQQIREIAIKHQARLCDLRYAFIAYLNQYNQKNLAEGLLTTDGVHLSQAGHNLVTETILTTLLSQ